ncbi:MAG: TonB-dependent receptor [Erythrobacter sp.]
MGGRRPDPGLAVMRRALQAAGLALLAAGLPGAAGAETGAAAEAGAEGRAEGAGADTDWPSIVVTAPASESRAQPPQLAIPINLLVDRQPRSAADALRGIAGVAVRTNSRGETTARIRGAAERQTQIFLDGAPLAVPWDGRIDLGLLPAGLLGAVRVVKGAAPIEYGANAVAGVVEFQTRQPAQGSFGHIEAGSLGSGSASAVLAERAGRFDLTLAAGGITRDAEPLAGPLTFNQPSARARTNTDLDAGSLFAAIGTATGDLAVRASVLHLSAARGIAPEGDRGEGANLRFWRYPRIALTQASITAALATGERSEIKLVGWRQWFDQRIDQFENAQFDALRASQMDEDKTIGARLTLTHPAGPLVVRWAASGQSSTHDQIDSAPPDSAPPGSAPDTPQRFRQNLYSLGVEADAPLAPGARLTLGAAYDRAATPLTGGRPFQPAMAAGAVSAALALDLGEASVLTLSGGRRTRFASANELFGPALGRFAINPDLGPEQAWLLDAEWRRERAGLTLVINPFLIRSADTLAQRVLDDGRRQRINLAGGATSFGVDGLVSYDATPRLRFELYATALSARSDDDNAPLRRLPQRASFEALAAVDWNMPARFDLRAELRAVGDAVDLDAAGNAVRLPAGAELALRAALPVAQLGDTRVWLTFAGDNLTNAQIFPQAGLPLPGRLWRIGLRFD